MSFDYFWGHWELGEEIQTLDILFSSFVSDSELCNCTLYHGYQYFTTRDTIWYDSSAWWHKLWVVLCLNCTWIIQITNELCASHLTHDSSAVSCDTLPLLQEPSRLERCFSTAEITKMAAGAGKLVSLQFYNFCSTHGYAFC